MLKDMTQQCANRLVMLYYEMDLVDKGDFNQNECELCVIGHGIRSGKMNGFSAGKDFDQQFDGAINWISLPKDKNGSTGDLNDYSEYLFGGVSAVKCCASDLSLPCCVGTPKDAQKRIAALLHKAGFDF